MTSADLPDAQGLDGLEPLIVQDPGDDFLRRRYIDAASADGAQIRAAEALKKAIRRVKTGDVRERVGYDIGTLYLKEGELPLARQAFLAVVVVGAESPSALAAARRVLELEGEPGDPQAIGASLELVAKIAPEAADRHEAAARLLAMHLTKPWKEARLVVAYQALVDSPQADEALAWLRACFEKKGDAGSLSDVYRALSLRVTDVNEARTLALESFRLAADQSPDKNTERWLWFLERFGPDHDAHRRVAPLLERSERWVALCRVLRADVDFAAPEERAPMLSRVGEILRDRVGDIDGATSAFGLSLSLDPTNEIARAAVERLMEEGSHRLDAAALLEPIYAQEGSTEGQLRVLETRAWLLPDPSLRLALFTAAMEKAALAGLVDRATALCRHAINLDASSPGLHARYDQLMGAKEPPDERAGRYESALDRASDPSRRAALLHVLADIRGESGDLAGAMAVWGQLLAESGADYRAHQRLIDATIKLGDAGAVLPLLDRACALLQGHEKDSMALRKAVWLSGHGDREAALELARQLVDRAMEPEQLDAIAEIARDQEDHVLYRHALELLAASGNSNARGGALEQLGDLQFERAGDRRAAVESWKAAAQSLAEADQERAQLLYERALDTLPDDHDAAERLIELYAGGGVWTRLPDVLSLLIRGGHPERAATHLIRFEESAIEGRALEEFVVLADEVIASVASTVPSWLVGLKRARARVLSADFGRQAEASTALRELIESSGTEDDIRAFEVFVESKPSAEERHRERRWLYSWRAAHAEHPVAILLEWARAEEEFGEADAAKAAYERVLELNPGQPEALEAVFRGRLSAGDFAGGLAALNELRNQVSEAERSGLNVRAADWLWTELGRHVEATLALAPVLLDRPPYRPAYELGKRLLADPTIRQDVIERLESAAEGAGALHIFEFLVEAGEETSATPEARRRWFLRILELSTEPSDEALGYALQGALEAPESLGLWEAAERLARRLGKPARVADAYHRVFVDAPLSPALADVLGRRMLAFEEDCAIASAASTESLLSVLDAAPAARWAMDRVKLALGAQARWDELFGMYDRAIAAASSDQERADLLHEAAFAAKDLSGEPRRAISYFEFLRALRPEDAAVDSALERLYEKQGLTIELIALLSGRARRAQEHTGFKLRELRHRIVTLWLELADTEKASLVLDQMLDGDATVADVADLLERVARPAMPPSEGAHRAATRAIARLEAHYERLSRMDDLVRVAEMALDLAMSPRERRQRVREWVGFLLLEASDSPLAFEQVFGRVAARVRGDATFGAAAYKFLLVRALRAWRRAAAEVTDDPENGAQMAVQALATLLVKSDKPAVAFRLLYRVSRLPFERRGRRKLVSAAAFVCVDFGGGTKRATRVFDELFDEDPGDEIAAKAMGKFAELLDRTEQHAKLAKRWEEQARIRASAGAPAAACEFWEKAGGLWEAQKEWEQAIAAYQQGARLSSETSYDALARIHVARHEWSDAVKALEWLYSHAQLTTPQARAVQLADVYIELADRGRARALLEEVLPGAVQSEHGDAIRLRLMDLYRRDEVWKPLARLLSAEALRADALDEKLKLVQEACEILQAKLGEPAEAAVLLRVALTWAPQDDAIRGWLLRALESLERWDEAAAVLQGQIELFGEQRSKERALTHHRLAHALVRAKRASEALAELRTAADMSPGHPAILHDLGRVALDVGEIDLSEASYRALLLALHHPAPDPAEALIHRADVFLDLGEIALRRGDSDRAEDLIDSAFDDAVEGGADLLRLEEALAARGRYNLLAREEERRADGAATLAQRALALGHWVDVWIDKLQRSAEIGVRIHARVARIARDLDQETLIDPVPWKALLRVHAAFREAETRDKLVSSLGAAIAAVHVKPARSQLRVVLGRLLLEEPARTDAAVMALQSALVDDPVSRDAADILSDVLEREGRFDELVGALEGSLRALSPEQEAAEFSMAMWRLGRALEQSGRRGEAQKLYESLLDREPVDGKLLSALAARLEELASARLADCLERWMTVDPEASAHLAPRLVELRDKQGDRPGLARALEAGFAVDPANPALRARLIDHYGQRQDWGHAAAALKRALDTAIAARPKDAELMALRAIAREGVGDVDGAMADLENASTVDSQFTKELMELLTRIVHVEGHPPAESHVLRLADLLIRLGRPKEARAELGHLKADSPNRREALRRIARAAVAEGDWNAAADAYHELLLAAEKDDSRDEVLQVASALVEVYEHAGRAEEAGALLQRTFDALADTPTLWPNLERLCEALGDYTRLALLLLKRADSLEASDEKVALWLRAARLSLEQGSDPSRALTVLERARSAAPDSVDVALVWARAQVALGRTQDAIAVLGEAVERSRGSRSQLASVYLEMAKAHLAADELVEAAEALKSAFAADWRTGDTAVLLGLVALDLGDEKTAERALMALTTMPTRKEPGHGAVKAIAFYHLASMAYAKGDLHKAKLLATKAASGDPAHDGARGLLERLSVETGRR
jgi:tetratricopeptide (TPR) repeat protein